MNRILGWALALVVVVGLAIDAYNHFNVASQYAGVKTSTVSQATLFRVEAALAVLAAVLVVVWASRLSALFALAVAGGGLILLVLYRYVDVGRLGPIPDMYQPIWNVPGKKWSVAGEVIAIVGSLALLAHGFVGARSERRVRA